MLSEAPLRAAYIRERNEKFVLKLIYKSVRLSQSEAAHITGLKPPTVFRIFSQLEERGYIRQIQNLERVLPERKGRKPMYYTVNPDAMFAIGIDFWASCASVVVEDFASKVVFSSVTALDEKLDADGVVATLVGIVRDAIERLGLSSERLLGIGIGAPGSLSVDEGLVRYYSRIKGMRDFPLRERFFREFGVSVRIHNNCSVIGMAECCYGAARGMESVFTLLIRSGVGGSFVRDGRAVVNHGQTVFEIGHVSFDPHGTLCDCGGRGCVESYLSEEALLRDVRSVRECPDMLALDALIKEGDSATLAALQGASAVAVGALRTVYQIVAPDAFVIVSRSRALSDHLASVANRAIAAGEWQIMTHRVTAFGALYDPISSGRAAGDMVFNDFFG